MSDRRDKRLSSPSLNWRKLAVGVAVTLLALVAWPTFGQAAKPTTYAPKACAKPRIEPRLIIIACGDAGFYLKVKRWSYWNGREAGGKAKVFVNDCVPSCAGGTFRKYRAKVRLTKPRKRTCGGRRGVRMFQKIKFDWKTTPPAGAKKKYDLFCNP